MCKVGRATNCQPLFKQVKVLTVQSLCILEYLLYAKSNLSSFQFYSSVHAYYAIHCDMLRTGHYSYHSTKSNIVKIGKKLYNILPDYLFRQLKNDVFKYKIKWLLSVYVVTM